MLLWIVVVVVFFIRFFFCVFFSSNVFVGSNGVFVRELSSGIDFLRHRILLGKTSSTTSTTVPSSSSKSEVEIDGTRK